MRLRQALNRLLCVPVCNLRAFPTQKQDFLTAVRPVARLHAIHFPATSRSSRFFNRSPFQISGHDFRPLLIRSEAYYHSETKQPLFFSTTAASCSSMSDSGHTMAAGEEVMKEQSQSKTACCSGPEDDARESLVKETCPEPQEDPRERGSQAETVTCSSVGASEEQPQAGEKEMEAESLGLQKVASGRDGSSQQTRSSLSSNKPGQPAEASQLSKRAQKKLLRKQKFKEQRNAKRAGSFTSNSNPGFDSDLFTQTDYYFENGLRKVYPYPFTFSTYAKERWYGRTLQDIFEHEFRVDSPDNFRTSVAKGFMKVNGKVAKLDHVIRNGDLIEHNIHRHENPVSGRPLEVVEDTEDVVVINKPASIPCHPCGKFRFNSIVFIMGKELGYANLRNIYRLDRLTSGVLIMGKTAKKTKELENHILHRHVQKEYLARVVGQFPEEEVTVDKPLDCLSFKMTLWRVVEKGGKPSRTTFKRLSYNGQTSLVKCFPHTGRTHQIRVHLQYLGHPIVNDPYYNSPAWGPQRGKGGRFEVPIEELCLRIMKEHNVGLWYDGENPLFHERLAAENQISQQPSSLLGDNDTAPLASENVDDKTDILAVTEEPDERNSSRPASEESPPAKKVRLDISAFSPSSAEDMCVADSVVPSQSTVAASPASHAPTADGPLSQIPSHKAATPENLAAAANPATETIVGAARSDAGVKRDPETGIELSQECEAAVADPSVVTSGTTDVQEEEGEEGSQPTGRGGGEGERRAGVERRGFDPQRWVPDPHCNSCRLKYIDPKPSDLLLYLHALRYKGPGWDYSTPLPDWAADDWQEPEDYAKYLQ